MEYRLDAHLRTQGGGRNGQRAEQLQITGSNGAVIYFAHQVPPARILADLAPSVWIKADRQGIQVFGHAILPHTIDPHTGRPVSVLLPGGAYSQVGVWERLALENVPLLLERQVRVLRLQLGRAVDSREAFVDQVWLNVYGGPGTTSLLIDDLDLVGIIPPAQDQVMPAGSSEPVTSPAGPPAGGAPDPDRPAHEVKLDGSVLLVDGHPFFPRIFPYHGEPLSEIAKTGFNAVRLPQPPTAELLAEARREGMRLISRPPLQFGPDPNAPPTVAPIGPAYDPVLAWHFGNTSADQVEAVAALADQLRLADSRGKRPILCAPETELRAYSRHVDLLELARQPLGTSLELSDYCTWLRERPRLARPGTPFWSTVQTQLSPATRGEQLIFPNFRAPAAADNESIRLLTYAALMAGARGIEFQSDTPLAEMPPSLRLTLTLLNLELDLIEPWTATGTSISTATSSDPNLIGLVLQTDKARLLVPMRLAHGSQYVPQPATAGPAAIVVPGVPESHSVYELTPAGLRPLNHKRVTGGIQVTLDDFQLAALVLITPEPQVIASLDRRLSALSLQAAQLQRDLTAQTLAELETIDRQLPPRAKESPLLAKWLATAREQLADADRQLAAGDRPAAFLAARQAMGPLEQVRRLRWEQATTTQTSLAADPFTAAFDTLPAAWRLADLVHVSHSAGNRLPTGECENMAKMKGEGWQLTEHRLAGVQSLVELSPTLPHGGRSSLRMEVRPADPLARPTLIETAPIWITTPPIPAQRGELLAIHAFVRIPKPITGSVDGLLILDSIGGEALAERVGQTVGWRQITLYRVAQQNAPVSITFALTGLGEAWIDDVTVEPLIR